MEHRRLQRRRPRRSRRERADAEPGLPLHPLGVRRGVDLVDWETGTTIYTSTSTRAAGDFNGDGKGDLAEFYVSGTLFKSDAHTSNGAFPDLLNSITNSLGGTTTVLYTPSSAASVATSAWPKANPPFVLQTATSVTANPNNSASAVATTTYSYGNALWHGPERRFLGFGTMTTTLPQLPNEGSPPTRVMTFVQSVAGSGLPDTT